tara:strand:+ start:304 stop:558 length:255 start_codon:yes stop_codon:yes gene_type:complete
MYSAKQIVIAKIDSWRECQIQLNPQYSPADTLSYVKECCEMYDLNKDAVKEIFEEFETPCYYDIEKDDYVFRDDDEEEDEEEED